MKQGDVLQLRYGFIPPVARSRSNKKRIAYHGHAADHRGQAAEPVRTALCQPKQPRIAREFRVAMETDPRKRNGGSGRAMALRATAQRPTQQQRLE